MEQVGLWLLVCFSDSVFGCLAAVIRTLSVMVLLVVALRLCDICSATAAVLTTLTLHFW